MKQATALLICTIATGAFLLNGEIVVKQDKDGRVIVTEVKKHPLIRKLDRIKYPSKERIASPDEAEKMTYRNSIRYYCRKYQVREDLALAVARAESDFNPKARARKGAMGIMQLMRDTADQYGVTNPYNAEENIHAGVRHLRYLFKKYNENLVLTLAAYNAGESAVAKYNGVPPYRETKTYIRRVLGFMGLGHLYAGEGMKLKKSRFYRYLNDEGRVVISDSLPRNPKSRVEIIE